MQLPLRALLVLGLCLLLAGPAAAQTVTGTLEGGDALPGFTMPVREVFACLEG